jgi:hypothetical protein
MIGRALSLVLLLPALLLAADSPTALDTRQHNCAAYLFTPEGYRSMTMGGDEAHQVTTDQTDVSNLKIFVFSGDAASRVTTIILSPAASFFEKEQRASGPASVRVIRDDGEITGEDWTYERAGDKVAIHRNVRVQFKEQLPGLLK